MRQEVSAGGIVYRNKDGKIDVLVIKDSYGNLAFPKGHLEKGETIEQAALRETMEEVNLENLEVITKIGTTKFWFTFGGERIHKTLHRFLMKSIQPDDVPSPQWEIQSCN
jgi:diadenosine hexaphosphate hydrolase (ATP-forming)